MQLRIDISLQALFCFELFAQSVQSLFNEGFVMDYWRRLETEQFQGKDKNGIHCKK